MEGVRQRIGIHPNTFRVYLKIGNFILKYIFIEKKTVLLLRYCGRRASRYFIFIQYKLKMLKFIPNVPSTFFLGNDVHSRMIHSFVSILLKCFIKSVGKPVNRLANQFEWFIQFPASRAESSELWSSSLLTQSCNNRTLSSAAQNGRCMTSKYRESDKRADGSYDVEWLSRYFDVIHTLTGHRDFAK